MEETEENDFTSEEGLTEEGLPKPASNPLEPAGNDLDNIIQSQINDDLWAALKGDLPCLEATRDCISQLQQEAVQRNPLLVEIDTRIEEINTKIEEARIANNDSIQLGIFSPGLQVLLQPQIYENDDGTSTQTSGILENIAAIFTTPTGVFDRLLSAIGVPILQSFFGGNEDNQRNAIAISDLQVKVAELQRGRAELANKIREEVYLAVFDYDDAAREFQISQEIAKRDAARVELLAVEYRLGEGDSNTYLNTLNSLDGKKAQTYRSWSAMRSRIEKIKLLVLGLEE